MTRLVLNRVPREFGVASILVPNQGVATLWDAVRSTAISLQLVLAQALRRATARKPDLEAELPDAGLHSSMPVVALPQKLANPMSDMKTKVKSAA